MICFLPKSFVFVVVSVFISLELSAQSSSGASGVEEVNGEKKDRNKYDSFVVNGKEPCKYDVLLQQRMQDPTYRAFMQRYEAEIRKRSQAIKNGRSNEKAPLITIPLVFHVLHLGEPVGVGSNIPTDQITSAVEALNRDFRRLAADDGIAQGANGTDVEIEFCLATIDPEGNRTNGINRVAVENLWGYNTVGIMEGQNGEDLKSLSRWPTEDYVNVWVVREIDNQGDYTTWTGGVLGYAYTVSPQPELDPGRNPALNPGDGIVVVNFALGNDPDGSENWNTLYRYSRTLTHEMGHHFNLQHTFKGQSCEEVDCTIEGDFVCDTPPTTLNTNCDEPACNGTQHVDNYMDYTDEACYGSFTEGQKIRMRAVLEGFSRGRLAISATGECSVDIIRADFTADRNYVLENEFITFSDSSLASPGITTWQWDFGDGTTSSKQNPKHRYEEEGIYTVTLTVFNAVSSSTKIRQSYIFVSKTRSPRTTQGDRCTEFRNYSFFEKEDFKTHLWGYEEQPVPAVHQGTFHGFAERFTIPGAVTFGSVILDLDTVQLVDSTNFTLKVYNTKNGLPGDVLVSKDIPAISCTPFSRDTFNLDTLITLADTFFVGFEFENTADWIQVLATPIRNNLYNSLYAKSDAWAPIGVPMSMALSIVPESRVLPVPDDNPLRINGSSYFVQCLDTVQTFEVLNDHNVKAYAWDFGNGATPDTSSQDKPFVTFSADNYIPFEVTLYGVCGDTISLKDSLLGYEPPNITATVNPPFCDENDGSITLTHNGQSSMQYRWEGFNTNSNTLGELGPGQYVARVFNGTCQYTETFSFDRFPAKKEGVTLMTPSTCGAPTGMAWGYMEEPGEYSFLWNDTTLNDTLFGVKPGMQYLEVLEEGCPVFQDSIVVADKEVPLDISIGVRQPDCLDSNGVLTASIPGDNNAIFFWGDEKEANDTLSHVAAGIYTLKVQSGTCDSVLTITVQDKPTDSIPVILATLPDTCSQGVGIAQLVLQEQGNYQYVLNDSLSSVSGYFNGLTAGVYRMQAFVEGCVVGDTLFQLANAYEKPDVDFTVNPNPIVENEPASFQSKYPSAGSHRWIIDTQEFLGDTVTLAFEDEGEASVLLVVADSHCTDSIHRQITIDNNVSIVTKDMGRVVIYPNPAQQQLNVVFEKPTEIHSVAIVDAAGRTILPKYWLAGQEIGVALDGIASGNYVLLFNSSSGQGKVRFQIQR